MGKLGKNVGKSRLRVLFVRLAAFWSRTRDSISHSVVVVVVVAGAYTGFLLSLELASLLECRRGPVHTLGKATAGE